MEIDELLRDYPLKVNSTIYAPLAQHFYFSKRHSLPPPSLTCMYYLADALHIPPSSVRVTLSRMSRDGLISAFKDEKGEIRYTMGTMLSLISGQASQFGKSEGFTLAVFHFKKEDEKQRYRVREILDSFGFKKFAQNVYLALKIDSQSILKEFASWGLRDNVFLFDCTNADKASMVSKIASLWRLDEWRERLDAFYGRARLFLSLEGRSDGDIYKRYSVAYSVFFTHFYEKHPAVPFDYLPEDYPLKQVSEFFEETLRRFGDPLVRFYCRLNQK